MNTPHQSNSGGIEIDAKCDEEYGCGESGKTLYPARVVQSNQKKDVRMLCASCIEEMEQEADAEAEREAAGRRREILWEEAHLPKRFHKTQLSDFIIDKKELANIGYSKSDIESIQESYERILSFYEAVSAGDQRMIIMEGGVGCGKTMLSAGVSNGLLAQGRSVRFYEAVQLVYRMMEPEVFRDTLAVIPTYDLVVLNDLTEVAESDHTKRCMVAILDHAWSSDTSLILSTNRKGYQGVKKLIGESGYDRIISSGGRVVFDWESFRIIRYKNN